MIEHDEALVERAAKALADAWDDYVHAYRASESDVTWRDGLILKEGAKLRARAVLDLLAAEGLILTAHPVHSAPCCVRRPRR